MRAPYHDNRAPTTDERRFDIELTNLSGNMMWQNWNSRLVCKWRIFMVSEILTSVMIIQVWGILSLLIIILS